jgi:DNA topoisomerase IA
VVCFSATYYDLSATIRVEHAVTTGSSSAEKTTNRKNANTSLTVKLIQIDGHPVANKAMDFNGSSLTDAAITAGTLHISTMEQAQEWVDALVLTPSETTTTTWRVASVTSTRRTRQPPVPYKTSTLP